MTSVSFGKYHSIIDCFNQLIYKRVYRQDYRSALVSIIVSLIALISLYTRELIE